MVLTQKQFEEQWSENKLSTTDWFDTTFSLFKELKEAQLNRREWYQKGYEEAMNKTCEGCKFGIFESEIKYVTVMDEQIECCLVCVRNCNDYYEPKDTQC